MKYIVGIGNPEKQYDKTRHNIGFRVLDYLSARDSGVWRDKKKVRSRTCSLDEATLVKPETYVNNTGQAVSAILGKGEATAADFLFVCDDVNLAFGKLRFRDSGSAGGHHGLESVISAFGDENFARLRIGVGNEQMPKDDLTGFVLGRFNESEEKELKQILEKIVLICESWVNEGPIGATNCLSRLQSAKTCDG